MRDLPAQRTAESRLAAHRGICPAVARLRPVISAVLATPYGGTMAFNTFETNEPALHELLEDIHRGKIQLPDFQRGWVWDDDHIRDLIASVSRSFPIGAVMMMETGGDGAKFKPRAVQGVVLGHAPDPKLLILDGQQRLTSLYLALRSGKAVLTRTAKGEDIERVY